LNGFEKDKCDPVLIAAILEELGFFDEKEEKDKDEVSEEDIKGKPKKQRRRTKTKITHLFMPDPGDSPITLKGCVPFNSYGNKNNNKLNKISK